MRPIELDMRHGLVSAAVGRYAPLSRLAASPLDVVDECDLSEDAPHAAIGSHVLEADLKIATRRGSASRDRP